MSADSKRMRMVERNQHTGAKLQSKIASEEYRSNYEAVFGKKRSKLSPVEFPPEELPCEDCDSCECYKGSDV